MKRQKIEVAKPIEIDYKNITNHYKIYYIKEELNIIINNSILIYEC